MLLISPFIPAFITRTPDDTHIVEILEPITVTQKGKTEANAYDLTRQFARILEDRAQTLPEQFNWTWWVIRRQEAECKEPKKNDQYSSLA